MWFRCDCSNIYWLDQNRKGKGVIIFVIDNLFIFSMKI